MTIQKIKNQLLSFLEEEGIELEKAREMIYDCNIIIEGDIVEAAWLYRYYDRFKVVKDNLVKIETF